MSVFFRKVIAIKPISVNESYISPNSSVISECELRTMGKTFLALAEIYTLVSLAKFAKFVSQLDLVPNDKIQILRFARNPFLPDKFEKFIEDFSELAQEFRDTTIEHYNDLELLPPKVKVVEHVYVDLINGDISTISIETSPRSVSHIYENVPGSPTHVYEDLSGIRDNMTPLTSTPLKKPIGHHNNVLDFSFDDSPKQNVLSSPHHYEDLSAFFDNRSFLNSTALKKPDIPELTRELKIEIRKMFLLPSKEKELSRKSILEELKNNPNGQVISDHLLQNNWRLFLGHSKFKKDLKQLFIQPLDLPVKQNLFDDPLMLY